MFLGLFKNLKIIAYLFLQRHQSHAFRDSALYTVIYTIIQMKSQYLCNSKKSEIIFQTSAFLYDLNNLLLFQISK